MYASVQPRAREVIAELAARGRYHFTTAEFMAALGSSDAAARQSLSRLAGKGRIASPARGFYVVLPPEYRRLGCLPPDQFIPALMEHRRTPYYVGLLSAAQYHGAAHHRPQEFQVVLERNRPPIVCGSVKVAFVARRNVGAVAVQSFNTPRGTARVSTAEATAIDLVGYMYRSGGLDRVAGVLSELVEVLDAAKLVGAAKCSSILWAQRLGYLLELVGGAGKVAELKDYVRHTGRNYTRLLPSSPAEDAPRSKAWRLHVNATVVPDA
ncbi:MAG: hypothetical protein F4149_15340 [Gammaproteobacteria bacterium]|nr:hypothetical protein [Gammaproteobacteria bacterium]MYK81042.1 hypothetical protein [Gammaproteobacteria bacterium]